jgi:hypothetical protein
VASDNKGVSTTNTRIIAKCYVWRNSSKCSAGAELRLK